jgi:hypothetical protein
MKLKRIAAFAAATTVAAACTGGKLQVARDVPSTIRAPAGEMIQLEMLAVGTQVYECAPDDRMAGAHAWRFRAPEAELQDRYGRPLGRHFAGPTWEALDGSAVVGEVVSKDPGPNASAIPWLLLKSKANRGRGTFAATSSIQRVDTVGGKAPEQACDMANLGQLAKVPYRATYYFFRPVSPA